jgi:hypothetical protein
MPTANEILNFYFSPTAMQQAAKNSIPASIKRLHEVRINKLKKITDEVGESSFKFTGETMIPNVFRKFKNIIKTGGLLLENFERRELRTLIYSLSYSEQNNPQIFSKPNELDLVFETLEKGWRDSYLIGLIDCYLKNWETSHTASAEKLGNFIFKKMRSYDGNRAVLKSLKTNMKFFDQQNGDIVLGSELALKNKQIREATKYLSLPENWFTYPYFSKVILAYYVKRKNDIEQFIDDLNDALHEHNNSTSNKRLVSKLIIQANANEFAVLQDKVKSIAFKLVGDPGHSSIWAAFVNASENEKEDLKKARDILNEWITRQFIHVFFEKCINDPRRKKFWLNYVEKIEFFKVFGPAQTKNILNSDKRISEYVGGRFHVVDSRRDVSAIMFRIGDYKLIEFSDAGYAFYAYKNSNSSAPSFEEKYVYSVESFRNGYLPMLVKRRFENIEEDYPEGRLLHKDGNYEYGSTLKWEIVLKWWLNKYLSINV